MGRAPCCDKANVKKGPWSPEEDIALKNYIQRHGSGGNWITLPQKAGLKRCGKSCRLRWLNYLRPDIKLGCFTEEEDIIIYNQYKNIGSKWSVIASQLPGRTDNDVKNHWNTKLKKKLMAGNETIFSTSIKISTINPSPPPPPPPPPIPTVKPETHNYDGFSMPSSSHSNDASFEFTQEYYSHRLVSEFRSFPMAGLIEKHDFSVPEDVSTTISVENSKSCLNWSNDLFLTEFGFGFGSPNEFLSGYGLQEKMGEGVPLPHHAPNVATLASIWATAESKQQGMYQSVTFS